MKKFISMLLAVSMSLSVMCSSFTVTAADGNNTAAQAESTVQNGSTGFDGLFGNAINEKIAEKSNDYGINSVEVSGNTATVSYRASKDCTVIVGIYEDDGTRGTHMLTFGTASLKAAETTAAVTIDNLPQYFYLKAYLVDSESNRPLSVAYENSSYIYSGNDDNEQTGTITDEEYEVIETVNKSIQALLNDTEYQSFDMTAKSEAMTELFERLEADKLLNEYSCPNPSEGELCRFEYACGVLGYTLLSGKFDEDKNGTGSGEGGFDENYYEDFSYSADTYNANEETAISTYSEGSLNDLLPDKRALNILILDGFEEIDANGDGKPDDRKSNYENGILSFLQSASVKTFLERLGKNVKVTVDYKVTIQDLKNLNGSAYDIIVFSMHGSRFCGGDLGGKNDWVMVSNEFATREEVDKYSSYLATKGAAYFVSSAYVVYCIRPLFFEKYSNNWNAKFIFSECCLLFGCNTHINGTTENADVFLNLPSSDVQAVVGFCDSVNMRYSIDMLKNVISGIFNNKTVDEALTMAKEEYGDTERKYIENNVDAYIASNKGNHLDSQIEYNKDNYPYAYPTMTGNKSFRFWEITGVELTKAPKKTDYEYGEELNLSGGEITLTFNNDQNCTSTFKLTDKKIADYIQVNDYYSRQEGTQYPYIKFTDDRGKSFNTGAFPVTVTRTVKKIKINTLPNKTVYYLDDNFDITGLTIDIEYKDGEIKTVDAAYDMISGFDSSKIPLFNKCKVTVTYKGKKDTFNVEIYKRKDVKSISINTPPDKTDYYYNEPIDLSGLTINVVYTDGNTEIIPVTENMISGFDSSKIPYSGKCNVTVTHGEKTASFEVNIFKSAAYIGFLRSGKRNVWQDDEQKSHTYEMFIVYSNGDQSLVDIDSSKHAQIGRMLAYNDEKGNGKIVIYDYDINTVGVQEIKAYYYSAGGTLAASSSTWVGVHSGASENGNGTAAANPIIGDIKSYNVLSIPGANSPSKFALGDTPDWSKYYLSHKVYTYNDKQDKWDYFTPSDIFVTDDDGEEIKDSDGNRIINSNYLMSSYTYLGGFDSSVTTPSIGSGLGLPGAYFYRQACFEYYGWIITKDYTVLKSEAASYSLYDDFDYEESDFEDELPEGTEISAETEVTEETETTDNTENTDNTDENTDETDGTEPIETETEVTEPVDTETTDTEQQPEETTVTETAEVEENPVFAIDNNGIFGFGRAAAKKSAQFANLHKNDIYNCYVVRSASADILGKDNLLFVGQTSSDGNGGLSFEYETTTGEDGEIILRPMSDDPTNPDTPNKPTTPDDPTNPDNPDKPTTPDTPNQPATPDNGGNFSNTTNTGVVAPFGGTNTESLTVTVENKVTGKTSKAKGEKTGGSVTVKLGTGNNGYFANVYTADGEYICSAAIENGKAKFTVQGDTKLKIVIDSIAYGEDVSSEAGSSAENKSDSIPYPVIITLIAVLGIYFKVGKKHFGQKTKG